MKRFQYILVFLFQFHFCGFSSSGPEVAVNKLSTTDGFQFSKIIGPSSGDTGERADWRIVLGKADGFSGSISRLFDGNLPCLADQYSGWVIQLNSAFIGETNSPPSSIPSYPFP